MNNWRVIRQRDGDGCFEYTIQDVATTPSWSQYDGNISPFVKHIPPYPIATTIDDLRARLMDMLAALDKPALILTPARLSEKP